MAIHINPKNKGKFNATKKKTGKTTEELTHSKNPLTRKRAIFAQNAKKWKHEDGGLQGQSIQETAKDIFKNKQYYFPDKMGAYQDGGKAKGKIAYSPNDPDYLKYKSYLDQVEQSVNKTSALRQKFWPEEEKRQKEGIEAYLKDMRENMGYGEDAIAKQREWATNHYITEPKKYKLDKNAIRKDILMSKKEIDRDYVPIDGQKNMYTWSGEVDPSDWLPGEAKPGLDAFYWAGPSPTPTRIGVKPFDKLPQRSPALVSNPKLAYKSSVMSNDKRVPISESRKNKLLQGEILSEKPTGNKLSPNDLLIEHYQKGGTLKEFQSRKSKSKDRFREKLSTEGYKDTSPDRFEESLTIPSNRITMKGVSHPVWAVPNNDKPVLMQPGGEYLFPNSTHVMESKYKPWTIRNSPQRYQEGGLQQEAPQEQINPQEILTQYVQSLPKAQREEFVSKWSKMSPDQKQQVLEALMQKLQDSQAPQAPQEEPTSDQMMVPNEQMKCGGKMKRKHAYGGISEGSISSRYQRGGMTPNSPAPEMPYNPTSEVGMTPKEFVPDGSLKNKTVSAWHDDPKKIVVANKQSTAVVQSTQKQRNQLLQQQLFEAGLLNKEGNTTKSGEWDGIVGTLTKNAIAAQANKAGTKPRIVLKEAGAKAEPTETKAPKAEYSWNVTDPKKDMDKAQPNVQKVYDTDQKTVLFSVDSNTLKPVKVGDFETALRITDSPNGKVVLIRKKEDGKYLVSNTWTDRLRENPTRFKRSLEIVFGDRKPNEPEQIEPPVYNRKYAVTDNRGKTNVSPKPAPQDITPQLVKTVPATMKRDNTKYTPADYSRGYKPGKKKAPKVAPKTPYKFYTPYQ